MNQLDMAFKISKFLKDLEDSRELVIKSSYGNLLLFLEDFKILSEEWFIRVLTVHIQISKAYELIKIKKNSIKQMINCYLINGGVDFFVPPCNHQKVTIITKS